MFPRGSDCMLYLVYDRRKTNEQQRWRGRTRLAPETFIKQKKLLSQWAGCASRCHVIGSVLQYTRPSVRDQSCQCTNFSLSWLHNKHIYFRYELTSCFAVFSIWSCRLMYLIAAVCFFGFFFRSRFHFKFYFNSFNYRIALISTAIYSQITRAFLYSYSVWLMLPPHQLCPWWIHLIHFNLFLSMQNEEQWQYG